MKIRSFLSATAFAFAAVSRAHTATFDSLTEGIAGLTLVDGGITFSNLDRRAGAEVPNFVIEDAHNDLAGLAGFTPNNTLGFGGFVTGGGTSFDRLGSFDFTIGSLASSASLRVFAFGNATGITLTLQGIQSGSVIDSSIIDLASGFSVSSQLLSLGPGTLDAFRVVADGPVNDGTAFVVVDTVSVQPVPEPASLVALGLGVIAMLRARKRV